MKYLIAKIFGLELVSVRFGYSDCVRFVKKDSEGKRFVWVYGNIIFLSEKERDIVPLANITRADFN